MRPLLGYGQTCVKLEKHWKHTFVYAREKTSSAMAKFVSKFNSTQSEDTYCTHASLISCTCDYTLGVKGVQSYSAITCWGWKWQCRMRYTWKSVGWFEVCLRGQPCTFHAVGCGCNCWESSPTWSKDANLLYHWKQMLYFPFASLFDVTNRTMSLLYSSVPVWTIPGPWNWSSEMEFSQCFVLFFQLFTHIIFSLKMSALEQLFVICYPCKCLTVICFSVCSRKAGWGFLNLSVKVYLHFLISSWTEPANPHGMMQHRTDEFEEGTFPLVCQN